MSRKPSILALILPALLLVVFFVFVSINQDRDNPVEISSEALVDSSPVPAEHSLRAALEVQPDLNAFNDWFASYRDKPDSADVFDGVRLAGSRREALKQLIPVDPEAALSQAIPFEERENLPEEIQRLLETPVRILGDLEVIAVCGLNEGQTSRTDRFVVDPASGERYEAHLFGERLDVTTKRGISMQGIAIDEIMAVTADPVRVLSTAERAARRFPEHSIQVGGSFYAAESASAIENLRVRLSDDERTLGPDFVANYRYLRTGNISGVRLLAAAPGEEFGSGEDPSQDIVAASPHTEGSKKILYIRARFADQDPTHEPIALATLQDRQGDVEQFWEDNSYGKSTATTTYTDTVTLADPTASWPQGLGTLLQQARDAALAAEPAGEDWDYNNYDFYTVVTSGGSGWGYGGVAFVGGKGSHMNGAGATYIRTAAHEFGHNLGLLHAQYWRTDSPSPIGRDSVPGGYRGDGVNDEHIAYGHKFSTMAAQGGSGDFNAGRGHFSTGEKVRIDWLVESDGDHVSLTESATVRLYRHDIQAADHASMTTGVVRSIKINRDSDDYTTTNDKRRYWLTHRWLPTNGIAENWLRKGLQIDWQRESYGGDGSILLDMTPFSRNSTTVGGSWTTDNNDKEDAALIIGRTYTDSWADIHITPTGQGGSSPNQWIDVVVNLDTQDSNNAPSINSFTASATEVGTGIAINFEMNATDSDGDTLAYSWDFGDNSIVDAALNSTTATKSWGSAGQYIVRATASDMKGGIDSKDIIVTIGSPADIYQISGRVLHGGVPVAGARVNVSNTDQTWTESDGTYTIVGLATGNYTVNAAKHGLTFTPQFVNPVTLSSLNAFGKDFHANEGLSGSGGLTMAVSPYEIDIPIGASAQFTAQGWDLAGDEVSVTPTWTVSGGGTIDSSGLFTASSGGTFTVTATQGGTSATAEVTVLDLSAVGITAIDDEASESGGDDGLVRIKRYGDVSDPLTVGITLAGTATAGSDYTAPATTVNFAASQANADISISALNDFEVESDETVIVGLATDPDYQVLGSEATATVTILDDGDSGPEVTIISPSSDPVLLPPGTGILLQGSATDDGFPNPPGALNVRWSLVSGPAGGSVSFSSPQSFETVARFSLPGNYTIALNASDGLNSSSAQVRIAAGVQSGTPSNVSKVIYYNFEAGSGTTALDREGGNHNGTLVNGPAWTPTNGGISGRALEFDGANDQVNIADSSDINSGTFRERTVAFWFKASDPGKAAKQVLFEEGGGTRGLNLYIESGTLYFGGWNNNENGWDETYLTSPLSDSDWHHVAIVLDAPDTTDGTFVAYLDGFEIGSDSAGALNSHTGDIGIGAMNDATRYHDGSESGTGDWFEGLVDEFHLWNRALTSTEIGQLFAGQSNVAPGLTLSSGEGGKTALVVPSSVGLVLDGVVTSPGSPTVQWSTVAAPDGASVTFGDSSAASTTAIFSLPGYYQLRLTATGSGITSAAEVYVHTGIDSATNPSTSNQVVYYSLDEGSGTTAGDSIGSDNNGTLTNGPTWTASDEGVSGSAVSFDGSDDVIAIENAALINTSTFNQRVISLWFNSVDPDAADKQVLFEEGGGTRGLNLYLQSGLIYFGGWNANLNGWDQTYLAAPVTAGQWHHAVLVLDVPSDGTLLEDGFKAYLDGVLIGSGQGAEMSSHTGSIGLGGMRGDTKTHDGNQSGDGHYFEGLIDEFHLWTGRSLSIDEIGALYSFGNIGPAVDAGEDVPAAENFPTLSLSGSSNDDGRWNGNLTHAWSVVSAPAAVTFSNPDSDGIDTVANVNAVGQHVFRLTVSDDHVTTYDDVTITAINDAAYELWTEDYPNLSSAQLEPGANPDDDAFTNLEEFAYGANPTLADSELSGVAPTHRVVEEGGERYFEIQFRRRLDHLSIGLTYTPQFSLTMADGSWSADGISIVDATIIDANFELVTARVDNPVDQLQDIGFVSIEITLIE